MDLEKIVREVVKEIVKEEMFKKEEAAGEQPVETVVEQPIDSMM